MAAFPHDCPHCGTVGASFVIRHEYRPARFPERIHAFAMCGVCSEAVVAVFFPLGGPVSQEMFRLSDHLVAHPESAAITAFYHAPATPEAPDHLPPNVEAFFLEAAANLKTGPNAAGAMFRKSIDVALKHVDSSLKGNLARELTRRPRAAS